MKDTSGRVSHACAADDGQGERHMTPPLYENETYHPGNQPHASADANSAVQAAQSPREEDAWNNILKTELPASDVSIDSSATQLHYNPVRLPVPADRAFVSPFASLEAAQPASYECCGNCMGALPNVNPQYAASCELWFCICCHSVLPAALFPDELSEMTVLRRCTACLEAAPEREAELLARLPVEIQSAVLVTQALVQVHKEVVKYDESVEASSCILLVPTPEMKAIESAEQIWHQNRTAFGAKLGRTVQEHGVATSESLFFTWIQSENERVVLNTRRVVLWSSALAARNVKLSREACGLLQAAGLPSQPALKQIVSRPATLQPSTVKADRRTACRTCSLPLNLPEPVRQFESGLCDCCERCLPLGMMKKGSNKSKINPGKPRFCLTCAKASPRILQNIPLRDGFGSHLESLTRAVHEMMDLLEHSNKTGVAQSPQYQQVDQGVDRSIAAWKQVSGRHIEVFARGGTPVQVSRELYAEFVSHGESMGRAVATQLRLLLEAALSGTLQVHIPDQDLELAAHVFDEIELSDTLRAHIVHRRSVRYAQPTTNQALKPSANALYSLQKTATAEATQTPQPPQSPARVVAPPVPCERCSGALSDVEKVAHGKLALCDCCKRAIPDVLLSKKPLGNGALVCQTCHMQHSQRCVSLQNWPVRPQGSRFESLPLATSDLRHRLNSSRGIQNGWNPKEFKELSGVVRAADQAQEKRKELLSTQLWQTITHTLSVQKAQDMYQSRVKADRTVDSTQAQLFKLLDRICKKRGVTIPQSWSSLFGVTRSTKCISSQAGTSPAKRKRNRRRSKSKSRNSSSTNTIAVAPVSQPPWQAPVPVPKISQPQPVKVEYNQPNGLLGRPGARNNGIPQYQTHRSANAILEYQTHRPASAVPEYQTHRSASRPRDGDHTRHRSKSSHREQKKTSMPSKSYDHGQSRGRSESKHQQRSDSRGRSRSHHCHTCSCCASEHRSRSRRSRSRSVSRSRYDRHHRSSEERHESRQSRSPRRGRSRSSRRESGRSSRRSPSRSNDRFKIKDERGSGRRRSRSHERRSRSHRDRSRSRSRSSRREYDYRSTGSYSRR